jgi:hypothetical protein
MIKCSLIADVGAQAAADKLTLKSQVDGLSAEVEIDSLGKSLKCEYSSIAGSAFVLSALDDCLIFSSIFADVCLDEKAESRRVNSHLNAAQTHAKSIADNFWADRSKAQALSLSKTESLKPECWPKHVVQLWRWFTR